jgi:hypothetical protein
MMCCATPLRSTVVYQFLWPAGMHAKCTNMASELYNRSSRGGGGMPAEAISDLAPSPCPRLNSFCCPRPWGVYAVTVGYECGKDACRFLSCWQGVCICMCLFHKQHV